MMRFRMMTIIEFNDVEAASVDVKVDVVFFEVRRNGLPYLDSRIHPFYFAPGCIANSFAVCLGRYK